MKPIKGKILNLNEGIGAVVTLLRKLIVNMPVIIVGIVGGSSTGKGFVSKIISEKSGAKILSMDDYYIGIDNMKDDNFDSPNALDLSLLKKHIILLKKDKVIEKPIYDFKTHRRVGYEPFQPGRIIIIEGLFSFVGILRDEIDVKLFIDASEKIRFQRRLKRDVSERGRTPESVDEQWKSAVEPMYKKYVLPQKKYADIIILNE